MSNTEIWKPIEGYEGLYEISNMGRVRSLGKKTPMFKPAKILKQGVIRHGYRGTSLSKSGKQKSFKVHHLVLDAFFGKRPNGYQANHKNGIKHDNRIFNLEWVTPKENTRHSYDVLHHKPGIPPHYTGESHPRSKLTWEKVNKIRELYSASNVSGDRLSELFGVGKSTIWHVLKNETWKV